MRQVKASLQWGAHLVDDNMCVLTKGIKAKRWKKTCGKNETKTKNAAVKCPSCDYFNYHGEVAPAANCTSTTNQGPRISQSATATERRDTTPSIKHDTNKHMTGSDALYNYRSASHFPLHSISQQRGGEVRQCGLGPFPISNKYMKDNLNLEQTSKRFNC